ncbi:NADP-dependent oxidoreductase [Acidimangrovimonas pyrenivorans]|uniref:NADP-dependent oxidoreductase n=1 Tax=Acidimangrovimonas pyrenivorans TaxID=2030798 RepID=A0ABV7AKT5_9RHOB
MTETMKRIVLASRPPGKPGPENFRLEEEPLPQPGPGEFLARVIWLSLDPYMRGRMSAAKSYAKPVEIGETMTAGCVAEVIASNHDGYAPGDLVVAPLGWATHGISDGTLVQKIDPKAGAPLSAYLGVLGMPGLTAWVGLNDILEAKPGETIVVSAATGAVGSLVGQLARLKGMTVIGVAGGADKCRYAVEELGFDACLDHRAAADAKELGKQIAAAAPDGVECYFENVGGKTLEAVLPNMKTFGRIALCGMIAWYSGAENPAPAPVVWGAILRQRLRVEGFIIFDRYDRQPAFVAEVAPRVADGTIHYRETVAEGLENAPAAFMKMLEGGNFGKQLVRIGADPA